MKKIVQITAFIIAFSSCGKDTNSSIPEVESNIPVVKNEATYDVIFQEGITYAEGLSHEEWNSSTTTTMQLKMDAFIPDNNVTNRPTLMLIHGGSFSGGTRKSTGIVNLSNYFASRGWVVFSIDYRLKGNKGTIPSEWIEYAENVTNNTSIQEGLYKVYPAIRDAKAALRWVVANADSYGINTNYITVGGGSAGAVTAIALDVSNEDDYTNEITSTVDPTLATTNKEQTYTIGTILDFWGNDAGLSVLDRVYGYQRFDSTDAPILIAHGDDDTVVPFSDAEELRDTYINAGVDYVFHPLVGYNHSAWDATVDGKNLGKLSFDFIVEQQSLTVE